MSRRTLLLIAVALLLIVLGLWAWRSFSPVKLGDRKTSPGVTATSSTPETFTPPAAKPIPSSPEEKERQAQEALKRQALSFAARQGTYSSVDGFVAMQAVYLEASTGVREQLEKARVALVAEHPSFGPVWGQTMHTLSARITSPLPLIGKSSAQVTVQAQQTIERGDAANEVSYKQIVLDFNQAGETWIVSRVVVQPFQP